MILPKLKPWIWFSLFATLPVFGQDLRRLKEFRPIGGVNNNLRHPELNAVPGNAELNLAPLDFTYLTSGPNPRVISNRIAGGTGANGENAQTTDATASA